MVAATAARAARDRVEQRARTASCSTRPRAGEGARRDRRPARAIDRRQRRVRSARRQLRQSPRDRCRPEGQGVPGHAQEPDARTRRSSRPRRRSCAGGSIEGAVRVTQSVAAVHRAVRRNVLGPRPDRRVRARARPGRRRRDRRPVRPPGEAVGRGGAPYRRRGPRGSCAGRGQLGATLPVARLQRDDRPAQPRDPRPAKLRRRRLASAPHAPRPACACVWRRRARRA